MRCLTLLAVCLLSAPSLSAADLNEKEQAFADLLTGSTLVGRFSIEGKDTPPRRERYEISKVEKLGSDKWVVTARIKYGKNDIDVPVAVQVHWANDTPVVSVTDISILGLGEGFTSRVIFYKDRYAGTWYHGEVGGHMWGKIEPGEEGKKSEKTSLKESKKLSPEDQRVVEKLEIQFPVEFHNTSLNDGIIFLSKMAEVGITFGDEVPDSLKQMPIIFKPIRDPRFGQTLPRILHPIGLTALIENGGIVIRKAGADGVPAISQHDDAKAVEQGLETLLPTEFVDAPLELVAEFASNLCNIDVEIAPGVDTKMLVNFDPGKTVVTVGDALSVILRDYGLEPHVGLGRVLIRPTGGKMTKAHRVMGETTTVECVKKPLSEMADYFAKTHDVPVTLAPGVDGDTPITYIAEKKLLRTALAEMLWPHDLKPVVRDGEIRIEPIGPFQRQ